MAANHPSQREFTRVSLGLPAVVEVAGKPPLRGETRNLSLKGLMVLCDTLLPSDTECEVTILLEGGAIEVKATGRVANVYEDGFAVQFETIQGVDSFQHLQNLVRFNADEVTPVEEEFGSHLGLRRRD